ncbi:MAG TPA: MFS transporter [Ilumatobacteraceae bacterium]
MSTATDLPEERSTPDTRSSAPKKPLGASYYKLLSANVISNLGDGVSLVAMPWLASAITRNPLLVATVAVVQRLPWLVFTLPAGVITDRVDRRRIMVTMDMLRFALTTLVALAVLSEQDVLPGPDELDQVAGTRTGLYLAVIVATLLLGMAEVLRDNSGQTIVPSIVEPEHLEKANGRMWSAEMVANTFAGPPLGSFLLAVAFALPFFVDAASFFVAAALMATIPGSFRAAPVATPVDEPKPSWRQDLSEGWHWLWRHELLRPMAIILGCMNAAGMISGAVFVLFAQEVLGVGPLLFTVIMFGGAIGGIVGGVITSPVSKRFGSGTCLAIVLGGSAILSTVTGLASHWPIVMVLFGVESLFAILWNVITVSLRQTIIPPHLLGRVNSVYRFFAWGMIPVGAAIGGVTVLVVDSVASRELALRSTWFVNAAVHLALFLAGRHLLTTAKIEAARAAALSPDAGATA